MRSSHSNSRTHQHDVKSIWLINLGDVCLFHRIDGRGVFCRHWNKIFQCSSSFFLIFFRNVRPFQKFQKYQTRQPPSILGSFLLLFDSKGGGLCQPPTDRRRWQMPDNKGIAALSDVCGVHIVTRKKRLDAGRRTTTDANNICPFFHTFSLSLSPPILSLPSSKENRR